MRSVYPSCSAWATQAMNSVRLRGSLVAASRWPAEADIGSSCSWYIGEKSSRVNPIVPIYVASKCAFRRGAMELKSTSQREKVTHDQAEPAAPQCGPRL